MVVYVLLFNARTDNEGIHAETMNGENIILMFEHEDDAIRYALMLEAQDFPEATVEGFDQAEIEEFCESAGYGYRLVPEGTLAVPPDQTLEQTTWDPDNPDAVAPLADSVPSTDDNGLSQAELDRMRQQLEKLL
ncbi:MULTISPECIES: DUF3110 domain-containing protein [Cyanophyceae]|uniref:DUF3110 domain-containing protein n=1 Tax=Cyanophyceae TaxID=3028117 RepID=UPI0016879CDD|nr:MULTISPECIES: DUF3110 domain-containing protein [Cyanophyceae]MBD1917238.1 DUF3110 domain-containing protein [Phormidium sp. FACHB-77]MBD2030769.1 DUF3110 domain-containing protein [Phormidium sp. FACHB-322]MBD2050123.1 DUF3110 domain-containing protein [Leptolyngbya sp. FACHB-60]